MRVFRYIAQQILELGEGERFTEQISLEGMAVMPVKERALGFGLDALRDHA